MATDNTNGGSALPPYNPYNPYNPQFPRAHYDNKYGSGNSSGTGNITTDNTNGGSALPPYNPYNSYNPQFLRAHYDNKYGSGNSSGTRSIATDNTNGGSALPPYNSYNPQFPRAHYGSKYGSGNSSGTRSIATDNTNGGSAPQPYNPYNPYNPQFPRIHYDNKYGSGNSSDTGNIAIISPANMGVPAENRTCETPPPDYEEVQEEINYFSDASIRRGFVRKVYFTLVIQLLITAGIICAFLYWEALKTWTIETYWFTIATTSTYLVLAIILSCCGMSRKVPMNYIFLGLFTIVEGLMLGSLTVYFNAEAVLWAVGATVLVSFSLILFAVQSKFDFTTCSGIMWVMCWSLISTGILCAIIQSQYGNIAFASLGTMIFSMYLVIDFQLILGGKHSLDPEEYIFAALILYLDIITVFLLILQLCSSAGE